MIDFSDKKILIFADTHLKCKFDKKWFYEILPLIKDADVVIVAGDFWENISCDFDKFRKGEYSKFLFPLLKNKMYFIHGNNDELYFVHNQDDLRLFSIANSYNLKFKSGNKIFNIQHGHLLKKKKNHLIKATMRIKNYFRRVYSFLKDHERYIRFIFKFVEAPAILSYKNASKDEKEINIFGHVHSSKHNTKDNFIILGAFKRGEKRYIWIKNGNLEFVDERY